MTEGAAPPREQAGAVDPFALVGETLAGRFRIDRFVAEGGFGIVYRATQTALGRAVALKILKPASDQGAWQAAAFNRCFEVEARTIARLKHPHIVEVYDFGIAAQPSHGDLHWMALEWLEGGTLEALLRDERAREMALRDPVATLALMRPVIQTVAYAHGQGVVHRDLKPGNIFLAHAAGAVVAKVLDFGIAQIMAGQTNNDGENGASASQTTLGFAAFSPDYAAPEQVTHGRTGPWTDVHALGLILTEVITGQAPYPGQEPEDRLAAVVAERRPTPAAKGFSVGSWEAILGMALARRPAERHPDADALLRALEEGITRPMAGSHPASAERPGRRLSRAAVIAAVIAGIGLAVAGVERQRRSSPDQLPAHRVMMAVLPFENLSGDSKQDYFTDGLTEGMISEIGRVSPDRLAVIARTSVGQYKGTKKSVKEIGRELGVDYVLESSAIHSDQRVRIDTRLIKVSDQTQLWAEHYERDLKDILILESDVAQAIAAGVQLKLTPAEAASRGPRRPIDPAVYDTYLRARYLLGTEDPGLFPRAIELLQETIKLDPTFAPAHATLALAVRQGQGQVAQYQGPGAVDRQYREPSETYGKALGHLGDVILSARGPARTVVAREAAGRALELDERLPEAHVALAIILLGEDRDWNEAARHYRRALELDPNNAEAHLFYGQYLQAAGRMEEAISERKIALRLSPYSLLTSRLLGQSYYYARRYDEAIVQLRRATTLGPRAGRTHEFLALVQAEQGKFREALAEFAQMPQQPERLVQIIALKGYLHARAGQLAEARAALRHLEELRRSQSVPAMSLARIYTALGERDEAFAWLEKAHEEHEFELLFLRADPRQDPLRGDARFDDLVHRNGTPFR